ncbi:PREDICTED: uncharacterized protein LOC104804985 [Tarenaya hassleriana]|uniref:uncharacterized protein LOC104804985 n=1 Tax=Tarenaya hassleriana TaxID=28532 RepID=UPI00053C9139|nr:PREDICTED: uncharacterized protein LOC104804985 [Tarenaya hassleriana]
MESLESSAEEWADFVVGQFYGLPPSMGRIIGVSNAMWSRNGPKVRVQDVGNGTYLFKMPNRRSRDLAMSRQIWHVGSCPMFVSVWSPYHIATKPTLTSIQTWVSFRNLPHQIYTTDCLNRIATAVGRPLYPDKTTAAKENVMVARILIDVNLQCVPPKNVVVTLPGGQEHIIDIYYDWLPPICSKCSELGHNHNRCPQSPPSVACDQPYESEKRMPELPVPESRQDEARKQQGQTRQLSGARQSELDQPQQGQPSAVAPLATASNQPSTARSSQDQPPVAPLLALVSGTSGILTTDQNPTENANTVAIATPVTSKCNPTKSDNQGFTVVTRKTRGQGATRRN